MRSALATHTMHLINLPQKKFNDSYLNRSVKTLSKGINLNKSKDVERACQFAILLYSANFEDDAISLVCSFARDIEYSEKSGAWIGKEIGLSLVAYHHFINGNKNEAKSILCEIFDSNPNLDLKNTDWVIERLEDDIECYTPKSEWPDDIRNMRQNAILGHTSTIASMIFNFLTCLFFCDAPQNFLSKAEKILKQEFQELDQMHNETCS